MKRSAIFALALGAAMATVSPASACSVIVPDDWGFHEARKEAKVAIEQATAIIDGEVVRPFIPGKQNAIVRAARVLKGPQQAEFEVGERDTCSIALTRSGERFRMLLTGGPDVYDLQWDQSGARHQDRLLRSDRRKAWPYRAGDAVERERE